MPKDARTGMDESDFTAGTTDLFVTLMTRFKSNCEEYSIQVLRGDETKTMAQAKEEYRERIRRHYDLAKKPAV